MKSGFFIYLMMLVFFAASVNAEIYRWTDAEGRIHFSNKPLDQGKGEKVDVQVNTFSSSTGSGSASSKFRFDPGLITAPTSSRDVVMYSAAWCGYCKQARSYFKQQKIPFKEYDIETTQKGKRDYKKLGGNGVPLILVGDRRMSGFSVAGFKKLYR